LQDRAAQKAKKIEALRELELGRHFESMGRPDDFTMSALKEAADVINQSPVALQLR
jgi:hypothetical protein